MNQSQNLAIDCYYHGKDYTFYCHKCGTEALEPVDEREFINLTKDLELTYVQHLMQTVLA